MIVIPMAGLSSRFFKAGFNVPKYQLDLPNGQTVFEWAVTSFQKYFSEEHFLFILRDVYDTYNFVKKSIERLGINSFEIIVLNEETKGQADTVYLGLNQSKYMQEHPNEALFIFNIDSRRHEFIKPNFIDDCDGYLEVFKDEGEHWSFIEINENDDVIRTTEKIRISDLCSDGLYFFKKTSDFLLLTQTALENNLLNNGELYIAPLYNYFIQIGKKIRYDLIDNSYIDFCGTPDEYSNIVANLKQAKDDCN